MSTPEQSDAVEQESSLERPPQEPGDLQVQGADPEPQDEIDPLDRDEIEIVPATVRRAPRFARFGMIGALLGVAAACLIMPLATYDDPLITWQLSPLQLAVVMALILAPIGALLACVLALILDRRSGRKVN